MALLALGLSACAHTSSGTGSPRSATRVTTSVSSRAARSASEKYGASRQAAIANSRWSLIPSFLRLVECSSTQTLHPLIWLARRWTISIVSADTPSPSPAWW